MWLHVLCFKQVLNALYLTLATHKFLYGVEWSDFTIELSAIIYVTSEVMTKSNTTARMIEMIGQLEEYKFRR